MRRNCFPLRRQSPTPLHLRGQPEVEGRGSVVRKSGGRHGLAWGVGEADEKPGAAVRTQRTTKRRFFPTAFLSDPRPPGAPGSTPEPEPPVEGPESVATEPGQIRPVRIPVTLSRESPAPADAALLPCREGPPFHFLSCFLPVALCRARNFNDARMNSFRSPSKTESTLPSSTFVR